MSEHEHNWFEDRDAVYCRKCMEIVTVHLIDGKPEMCLDVDDDGWSLLNGERVVIDVCAGGSRKPRVSWDETENVTLDEQLEIVEIIASLSGDDLRDALSKLRAHRKIVQ